MDSRRARLVLIASLALLVGVGAAWTLGAQGDRRADLVGPAVTSSANAPSPAAPPTTATPTTLLPAVLRPPGAPPLPVAGVPQRLTIPALGIDDPVVPVARALDGSMEIPGADEAGWYSPGPRPGEAFGSAVIAAHIDYNGNPGVFLELNRLEAGSEVVVKDDTGAAHRYRVVERFQVDKDQLPRAELFRTGGSPVLTLVTCGGAFDAADRTYLDNIVVRAVPA